MKIVPEVSAADVARARWMELVEREFPAGAIVASIVTVATFAPLLAVAAKVSVLAWAVAYPFCAAGIGIGIRRLASAVTVRYGFVACFAAALCGLLSSWLLGCGTRLGALQSWVESSQCFAGMQGDVTLVAAAFVVAAFVAFFSGFRQVRVSELLPQKR